MRRPFNVAQEKFIVWEESFEPKKCNNTGVSTQKLEWRSDQETSFFAWHQKVGDCCIHFESNTFRLTIAYVYPETSFKTST